MMKNLSGIGWALALGLSLGAEAIAAGMDRGDAVGSGKILLSSAAQSIATIRTGDQTLEGSKFTREASCIPGGGVSRAQMVLATVSYLKQHPQDRGLPAGTLLRQALREAYPCPE